MPFHPASNDLPEHATKAPNLLILKAGQHINTTGISRGGFAYNEVGWRCAFRRTDIP